MKKILAFLLSLITLFSLGTLYACGDGKEDGCEHAVTVRATYTEIIT